MKNTFTKLTAFAVVATMALGFNIALAAAPQNASDNMTRQKISENADHAITSPYQQQLLLMQQLPSQLVLMLQVQHLR